MITLECGDLSPLLRKTMPTHKKAATSCRTPKRRRAFSILESAGAAAIVGVMLVLALKTLGATTRGRQAVAQVRLGPALAQQLLTEVLQSYYVDPGLTPTFGPESGESIGNRSKFDDVDDYNNWTESPPQLKNGTTLTDYTGWTRTVAVAWANPTTPTTTSASDQGLKRITVTVTDPSGRTTTLVGLRAASGNLERQPATQTTYTTWTGIDLLLGNSPSTVRTGISLTNHAQ
jgi:MSHA pilin protein MshD